MIKKKRVSKKKRNSLKLLLAYELERNFWSFKSLFGLWRTLSPYESKDDIKLSLQKGIESYYTVKVEEVRSNEWSGQAVPPFYFDRFEKLLLQIAELGERKYSKIQSAYSSLKELDDFRVQTLNLFADHEWLDFPDMTFDFLKEKANDYEEYYSVLNEAYKVLTDKDLTVHRLE